MQLITFTSAVAALVATAGAAEFSLLDPKVTTAQLMANINQSIPIARIVNRCDYDVYIWSVAKNAGCGDGNMLSLKKGEVYHENLRAPLDTPGGISIKISKVPQCKPNDITQLEYFVDGPDWRTANNWVDVSYVDCTGFNCPTINEGFYLQSGNQQAKAYTASAGNTICPVLSCTDKASCSKVAYILPDDVQTRDCPATQNLDFYMCGGQAPSAADSSSSPQSNPPSNSPSSSPSKPAPKPSSVAPASSAAVQKANVAAVTNAPQIDDSAKAPKVKTAYNVVYVTKYEYVNAKRHEHAHARRHQKFHA